jgi:hypothetical protein
VEEKKSGKARSMHLRTSKHEGEGAMEWVRWRGCDGVGAMERVRWSGCDGEGWRRGCPGQGVNDTV